MSEEAASGDIRWRHGVKVDLVSSMGTDRDIAAAARISTAGGEKSASESLSDDECTGLIRFLMRNRHGTPFEHNAMVFRVEAPIAVFREWHRHRIGWSYNEESARYRRLLPSFYVPTRGRPLVQVGKPGSYTFVEGTVEQQATVEASLKTSYETSWESYERMLEAGIAREVARYALPVGTYSSMYATCNARSLMHFLSLRSQHPKSKVPSFPMHEIELCSRELEGHFKTLFPFTHEAFTHFGRVAP